MIKKIWDFLGSLRLAIILIIIFSVVSLVGIIIPQGLPKEQYITKWGDFPGKGILFLGINRIFSTVWFYVLLEALSINVLVCASTRLWKNIKISYRTKFWSSTEKLTTFKHHHSFLVPGDSANAEKSVISYLKRRLYSITTQPTESGIQICALKGKLKSFGSFLFHIGIIFLFLGGLYGRLKGHTYFQQLRKNQIIKVQNRDFLLRCDWFELEKNEFGAIKDYKSKLALLNADSSQIMEKIIEVNSPLSYRGIRFYQTTYGLDPENIENILLNINGPGIASPGISSPFEFGREVPVPHSDLKLHIQKFFPDFVINIKTKQAYSRSLKPNNPAFKVVLLKGTDTLFNQWIFEKFPKQHAPKSKYIVSLMKYTPGYYTGIQVRDNPGVPFIWISIIIMTFGIFVTFYSKKETFWIFIEPEDGENNKISIGALLQEGSSFSQTRFETICQSMKKLIHKS